MEILNQQKHPFHTPLYHINTCIIDHSIDSPLYKSKLVFLFQLNAFLQSLDEIFFLSTKQKQK